MKSCLLKFLAGAFCLYCSSSLLAQTNVPSNGNNQVAYEKNSAAADSSYGFYMIYAAKEVQTPEKSGNNGANSLAVSSAETKSMFPESLRNDRVTIAPNPVKNITAIKIEATREHKFTIEVSSVAGKLLQVERGNANKGINVINLNLHDLAKGIYFVTVVNDMGERKTVKVIKE
jgi:hypothetical protein